MGTPSRSLRWYGEDSGSDERDRSVRPLVSRSRTATALNWEPSSFPSCFVGFQEARHKDSHPRSVSNQAEPLPLAQVELRCVDSLDWACAATPQRLVEDSVRQRRGKLERTQYSARLVFKYVTARRSRPTAAAGAVLRCEGEGQMQDPGTGTAAHLRRPVQGVFGVLVDVPTDEEVQQLLKVYEQHGTVMNKESSAEGSTQGCAPTLARRVF